MKKNPKKKTKVSFTFIIQILDSEENQPNFQRLTGVSTHENETNGKGFWWWGVWRKLHWNSIYCERRNSTIRTWSKQYSYSYHQEKESNFDYSKELEISENEHLHNDDDSNSPTIHSEQESASDTPQEKREQVSLQKVENRYFSIYLKKAIPTYIEEISSDSSEEVKKVSSIFLVIFLVFSQ